MGSARSEASDLESLLQMKSSFNFNILLHSIIIVITILLLCFNIDKMSTIFKRNFPLFIFMIGSLIVSLLEIVLLIVFKAKLSQENRAVVYRASVLSSVLINLYSVCGLYLMYYGHKTIPGLFSNGTHF